MKKIIFIISILLVNFLNVDAQTANKPIKIRINFDIAAKKFDCESGIGICKGDIGIGGRIRNTPVDVTNNNGNFTLTLVNGKIPTAVLKDIQSVSVFPIEEKVSLSLEQSVALGSKTVITFLPGNYKLMKDEVGYSFSPAVIR